MATPVDALWSASERLKPVDYERSPDSCMNDHMNPDTFRGTIQCCAAIAAAFGSVATRNHGARSRYERVSF